MSDPQSPDLVRVFAGSATPSAPEPGLTRHVLAHNERLMLVEHHMAGDWVGTRHAHPHDQLVYIISGRLQFSAAGETFEVATGDSLVVRGGIEHQARALAPSVVLDVFTPYRAEYVSIDKG